MRITSKSTYFPQADAVDHKCYVIDAKDKILGRVAAKAASLLRGKHKAIYSTHIDTGDTVIIINADKIRVTGKKLTDKIYYRYSGYPSGQKAVRLEEMMKKHPTEAMRLAVDRMLPSKGPLSYKMIKKLKIYAGDKHPHQAQKPISYAV